MTLPDQSREPSLASTTFPPVPRYPFQLLSGKTIAGWPSGRSIDSEDTRGDAGERAVLVP